MGSTRSRTREEIEEHNKKVKENHNQRLEKIRRFAMKCTTIAVDNIVTEIVRPGPKPEERECYDVANEIREFSPIIIQEIMKAIIVEANEDDEHEVISSLVTYIDENTIEEFFKEKK